MKPYSYHERLLTITNVNLSFGDNVILRDINFHVDDIVRPNTQQGQIIALLGPSGVGKTQLFKCIAGLQNPTTGSISLIGDKGVQVGQVGVVFQHYPLFIHRTVRQNLLMAMKKDDDVARVLQIVEQFSLTDHLDKYPGQLSGGQRQRVSVIQQTLSSDHYILMDEPFSGLDIVSKNKIVDLIRKVSCLHENNTVIFTTHDIETAVELADTIIIMGHERDVEGKKVPGATIRHVIDLIKAGIAWESNVTELDIYQQMCKKIKQLFVDL